MMRPSGHAIYAGVLSELVNGRNQTLITESGVLGGDLLPRAFFEPTFKELEKEIRQIAMRGEDEAHLRVVGSGRHGIESRAVFGDIDVILRCRKPETLSRIKQWVMDNADNVRDIQSKEHGDTLTPEKLGHQFSFLFPIRKEEGNEMLTIGELRAILQARDGHTNWHQHHDERLRVRSNLKNIDGKSGIAMVQVDVMRAIVDGVEMEQLSKKAEQFIEHLKGSNVDNFSKYTLFLQQFLDDQDVHDFEEHYEFLRNHGEMQTVDAQQMLTAVYYMKERGDHGKHLDKRFDNTHHRYSYHFDALQLIYFLANQVGMVLDDDNFTRENLSKLVDMAKQAGLVGDKMTVEMLSNPAEAFEQLKGKSKDAAKTHILNNTKNKRSQEGNPDALYRNYGTREVKKL